MRTMENELEIYSISKTLTDLACALGLKSQQSLVIYQTAKQLRVLPIFLDRMFSSFHLTLSIFVRVALTEFAGAH